MNIRDKFISYIHDGLNTSDALCKIYSEILSLQEQEYQQAINDFLILGVKSGFYKTADEVDIELSEIDSVSPEINDFLAGFEVTI